MIAPAINSRHRLNALFLRGVEAQKRGEFALASGIFREILAADRGYMPAIFQAGTLALQLKSYEQAEQLFRMAIHLKPDFQDAWYDLALTLQESGRIVAAFDCYLQALKLNPDFAPAWVNSGTCLLALGDVPRAVEHCTRAMECTTPAPEDRYNRGLANILLGRWKEGWEDFEYRWNAPSFKADYPRGTQWKKQWIGEQTDAPVLLWAEQGFGDTLMVLRYIPLIRARASNLVVEVQPQLVSLLHAIWPDLSVVAIGTEEPMAEYQIATLSLPYVFQTTPETVPPLNVPIELLWSPYVDPGLLDNTVRIGLCWAGRAEHRNDGRRSIPLSALWPLLQFEGVSWQALQLDRLEGIEETPLQPLESKDWVETARIVASCDLVITVDTAIAHLAGLLGKPTWLLLSAWPDFRWMLERADTPWYPSVKLYRQSKVGDWMKIIMQVRKDLDALRVR